MTIHLKVLNPRQAEAGKIKIGRLGKERPKNNGQGTYRVPVKLDHFLITKTERGDDGNFDLDVALMELLPKDKDGKIREIPILLSSDDIEEVFPTTLACYSGRNLFCRGDGNSDATRYEIKQEDRDGQKVTIKTGRSKEVKCPCNYLGAKSGLQCKPHGTLWVTIASGEQTRIGARHSFRTTSWESVGSVLAGLQEIQRMVGTLVGPPLKMYIRPKVVRPKGSDRSNSVYVVYVTCTSKDIQALRERVLAQAQMRHNVAALAGRPVRLSMAEPGRSESPAEQALIQQEYHPDTAPDADDDVEFDPTTGEVFDTDAVDTGGWSEAPRPEDESQVPPPEDPRVELPEDHPVRTAMKMLLTEVARVRDFSDADLKKGRFEIWNEGCEAAECPRLPWKSLTLARAQRIEPKLRAMLTHHDEEI